MKWMKGMCGVVSFFTRPILPDSKIIRGHKYKDKDNDKDNDKNKDTYKVPENPTYAIFLKS